MVYPYKVVGVTFKNPEGKSRQAALKKMYNAAVKNDSEDYDVELVPYEYEGQPAVAVLLDGFNVGNIAAEQAADVADMVTNKRTAAFAELSYNGCSVGDMVSYKEYPDLYGMELDEIRNDPEQIYSAMVFLTVIDEPVPEPEPEPAPAPDLDPAPEPEPKKKRFSLFGRKK